MCRQSLPTRLNLGTCPYRGTDFRRARLRRWRSMAATLRASQTGQSNVTLRFEPVTLLTGVVTLLIAPVTLRAGFVTLRGTTGGISGLARHR